MSHSFGESYRVGSTKGIHALTVFCSWDYKVTQKRASRVQQDSICTQLKVSSYLPRPGPADLAWMLFRYCTGVCELVLLPTVSRQV